jgi:hypothetical protein
MQKSPANVLYHCLKTTIERGAEGIRPDERPATWLETAKVTTRNTMGPAYRGQRSVSCVPLPAKASLRFQADVQAGSPAAHEGQDHNHKVGRSRCAPALFVSQAQLAYLTFPLQEEKSTHGAAKPLTPLF